MIFITGDTHGDIDFAKLVKFSNEHKNLTKSDYMIIAGDFGGVWSAHTLERDLDPYSALPFTVLFVDGNHENFDLLDAYPVSEWKGGKVHYIRGDIIHLMRGQVYEIEGKTVFTFGGATSIDRYMRREGISWWARELPDFGELDEALKNLEKHDFKVDIIVTHACGERALYYPPLRTRTTHMECKFENSMLSNFEVRVDYGHWYFGHYHMDGDLNAKQTALYQNILRVK